MPRGALCAVLVLCAGSGAAQGAVPRDDRVLVKIDPDATSAERAEVWSALDADRSRGLPGGWREYRLPRDVSRVEAARALRGADAADAVEIDRPVLQPSAVPNDPLYPQQWALPKIGGPQIWDAPPGDETIVAVLDTGVDVDHPDLDGRIWSNSAEASGVAGVDDDANGFVDDVRGWDFANGDASVFDSAQMDWHGTHVAGIVGAEWSSGAGVAGIARNARIMPIKFLTAGGGSLADAIAGLDYARRNGARVVNASFGAPVSSQALCDAVAAVTADGVTVVSAAGNAGIDIDRQPYVPATCDVPGNVVVASTEPDDHPSVFSGGGATNTGASTVDLAAPGGGADLGDAIVSTVPRAFFATAPPYSEANGTSMAAPLVAGTAAILLGDEPGSGPVALKTALVESVDPSVPLAPISVSGGRLNAPAAAQRLVAPLVDTDPPDPFFLAGPADGAATGDGLPELDWTEARDRGVGTALYRVNVDGAPAAAVPAEVLSATPEVPLSEGPHTWSVDAEDGQGNVREGDERTFVVDLTPPESFSLTTPPEATSDRPDITWEPSVDLVTEVSRYEIVAAGAAVGVDAPATSVPWPGGPLEGTAPLIVTAIDAAGNTREAAGAVTFLRPRAPVVIAPLGGNVTSRPELSWQSAVAGTLPLARIDVRIDGQVAASLGASATTYVPAVDLPVGAHTWSVTAVDAGGHASGIGGPFAIAVPPPSVPPPAPPAALPAPPPSTVVRPSPAATSSARKRAAKSSARTTKNATVRVRVKARTVRRRYEVRFIRKGRVIRRVRGFVAPKRKRIVMRVPRSVWVPRPKVKIGLWKAPPRKRTRRAR